MLLVCWLGARTLFSVHVSFVSNSNFAIQQLSLFEFTVTHQNDHFEFVQMRKHHGFISAFLVNVFVSGIATQGPNDETRTRSAKATRDRSDNKESQPGAYVFRRLALAVANTTHNVLAIITT